MTNGKATMRRQVFKPRWRTFEQLERRDLCTVSPFDVTGDGLITPADVVQEINAVEYGQAKPLDVLRIINHINTYGTSTPAEYPIVGSVPVSQPVIGEPTTLGRIKYDATKPTVTEITVIEQLINGSAMIAELVLADRDGAETFGVWSQSGTVLRRWTFQPVVDGAGVLELRGTINGGPLTIWGLAGYWDTVADRPSVRGFDLARVV